jgi:hypothetical protein
MHHLLLKIVVLGVGAGAAIWAGQSISVSPAHSSPITIGVLHHGHARPPYPIRVAVSQK